MLLSESTSKELIGQFGVLIPEGRLATSADQAEERARSIRTEKYVVKAQIAAGGRGLGGGIKFAATPSAVREQAAKLLGSTLVTAQTGSAGEKIGAVYVEAAHSVAENYYIGFALDPRSGAQLLLASSDGGVTFEESAQMDPTVVRTHPLPLEGDARPGAATFLASVGIGATEAVDQVLAAARAFRETDMSLLEINPFAKTSDGSWIALDAKVALDANAAFRHPEFESLVGHDELTGIEREAQANNINLVKLTGNIGVVVNGAGLGLATNDMIKDAGGAPANFMDIRTTATSFDIAKGIDLILQDKGVKVVLLNVYGGGMTVCDTVAEGVSFAFSRAEAPPPVVARLAGTNAEYGHKILSERCRAEVETFSTMSEAVARAVAIGGGR